MPNRSRWRSRLRPRCDNGIRQVRGDWEEQARLACRLGPKLAHARTLRAWRERFLGETDEVRRLGFDDAFVRMWEYYLASCEGAFEERYLGCVQMLFTKPDCRRGASPLRLR